jgi:hypothetical protein
MQIPLALTDAVVIEEVSLPLWKKLFEAVGLPPSLVGQGDDALTHDAIGLALRQDVLNAEQLQALEVLNDLGTPEGREAISAFATERQIPPGTLPQGVGERDLAVHLFLEQRTDGALAEVLSRAQVQVQEGSRRRFNDFIGDKPKPLGDLAAKKQQLEAATLAHCREKDLGEHVQVRAFADDDGAYIFQIMRSHHTRTPLAVTSGSAGRAKIEYRPVHADLVRYESDIGRLRITARAASIVEFYRKAFGQALFGDETFFGAGVCNLTVLQEKGRAAFANHNVSGAGGIWMTECLWERSDRERVIIRAADCFDTIEKLGLPLADGQLIEAKLKIEVTGKSARPVTVTVRAPSRIEVSQVFHEGLVNEVLTAIGVRDAPAAVAPPGLWALHPWRHPVPAWRECFGRETDALVKKGVLMKTQMESIAATGHPGAGRVLQAVKLSPGEFLGVSQAPEIPSQSLSATDLDGLDLVVPAFQSHLRELLEITGNAVPWQAGGWLLDLGVIDIHAHSFRLFYALRKPPQTAEADIKTCALSIHPVLLLPKGVAEQTSITRVLLDKPLPNRRRVLQDIVAAAHLTGQVPALLLAPVKARLVVDALRGQVWFDGIEIPDLKPGTQPFKFVEILACQEPSGVENRQIAVHVAPGRDDTKDVAKDAKRDAKKAIKKALDAVGHDFDDPFKPENGGYRLTVPAHVRKALASPAAEC